MTKFLNNNFKSLTIFEGESDLLAQFTCPENNALFDKFQLQQLFESIIIEHLLEYVNNLIGLFARVKNWLASEGRLFLYLPNCISIQLLVLVKRIFLDNPYKLNWRDYVLRNRRVYNPQTFKANRTWVKIFLSLPQKNMKYVLYASH
jgi:hypothetical protein